MLITSTISVLQCDLCNVANGCFFVEIFCASMSNAGMLCAKQILRVRSR
jgi:hypothetical protein